MTVFSVQLLCSTFFLRVLGSCIFVFCVFFFGRGSERMEPPLPPHLPTTNGEM